MAKKAPFCPNGGLTLVPLPGFEKIIMELKDRIESMGGRPKHFGTPVDVVIPKFGVYANGETSNNFPNTHVLGHDCVVVGSGPGTDKMLMELLWTISVLGGRHAKRITIETGYFPHSRSDKDEGNNVLSGLPMLLALVRAATSDVGLYRWICTDPHSEQITSAGHPGQVTPVFLTRRLLSFAIEEAQRQPDGERSIVLAFPDDSAHKRYEKTIGIVEKELSIEFPSVIAFKRRTDSQHTKILGLVGDTDKVEGARVITFDDEMATGGSNFDMAQQLKQTYGAHSVWACVSHAVLCGNACRDLLDQRMHKGGQWIDRVVVTDTIPVRNRPEVLALKNAGILSVYSWLEDLAWIIYRHHWNLGIRELR